MKSILDRAITAMRSESVDGQQVENAAARVFEKLQAEHNKVVMHPMAAERISSCADFQSLIPAYLSKSLTESRALLLEDHTRECVACRHALQDARFPRQARETRRATPKVDFRKYAIFAAAATVVLVAGLTQMSSVQDLLWPMEISAIAQTVDGNLFLVAGAAVTPIIAGQRIERQQVVRTGKDSGAILQLADGSKVEMRQRSELFLNRASDGVSINLDRGSVIVTAAKQRSGHLYVATEDCTVGVVGTIFSVNTGAKGSRVSVLEGEVHVEHGSTSKALFPGQQLSTNPVLGSIPLEQDIAWSREADIHRELIKELVALQKDLGARLAALELRYTSNLLNVVPPDTIVLASLPNMTEQFGQAYDAFRQRVTENPILRPWWEEEMRGPGITLDELITRVRTVGTHLGPEILIIGPHSTEPGGDEPILIAETAQPEALTTALAGFPKEGLVIKVEAGLFVVSPSAARVDQILALRRQTTSSAFASTKLYARVASAYQAGVGWLLAADLEGIFSMTKAPAEATQLGFSDAQQLLIEQKTGSGNVAFHATLGFNQPRRGMVSWLAEPGSIGALDFVSPNAYGAAAVATKDPSQIVDDLFAFLQINEPKAVEEINEVQRQHRIDIRHDLAEPLGAEFLFAVDGPILPSPSWKVVVEVYDSARLQNTIEWIVREYNQEAAVQQMSLINMSSEVAGGRTFYKLTVPKLPQEIHYTFWTGYLIVAPNRTLLTEAIQYKETGNTLAKSAAFRSQIPADSQDYVSGFFFQNVRSMVPGSSHNGVLTDFIPTLICLYGESDRIVMSSKGLLGMNLASLTDMVKLPVGAQ